jgi:hypothetical protein
MPISREMLEGAQRPLAERILAILKEDPSVAYSLAELYAKLEGFDPFAAQIVVASMPIDKRRAAFEPLGRSLQELIKAGRVVTAHVQGMDHYAIAR